MPSRRTVIAEYQPTDRFDEHGRVWIVAVPQIGRQAKVRSAVDGISIDLADAETAVRDLMLMWSGWEAGTYDIELVSARVARPQPW